MLNIDETQIIIIDINTKSSVAKTILWRKYSKYFLKYLKILTYYEFESYLT